jgi:hypothetical protein
VDEKILCKICNKEMARIVYGYPTEALSKIASEEGWILGGCMFSPISRYCRECKISWSDDLGFDEPAL